MNVRKLLALLPLIIGMTVSIIFFFFLNVDSVVEYVGFQNAYILMFAMAGLGGMTTFNTVPYFALILILASAGMNPVLIGLSSAFGVIAGDSFSYFSGKQGAQLIPAKLHALFTKVHQLAVRFPRSFPLVCFIYGAFSPLSNNFITIPAGMAKISYWRVMVPLGIGNIIFNIGFAYLSVHAYEWVQAVFIG